MKTISLICLFVLISIVSFGKELKGAPMDSKTYSTWKADLKLMYKYESPKARAGCVVRQKVNKQGQVIRKSIFTVAGKKLFTYTYNYDDGALRSKKLKCNYRAYKGDFYYSKGKIVYMTFRLITVHKIINGERQYSNGKCVKTTVKKSKGSSSKSKGAEAIMLAHLSYQNQLNYGTTSNNTTTRNTQNTCPIAQPLNLHAKLFKRAYTSVKYDYDLSNRIYKIKFYNSNSYVGYLKFSYDVNGALKEVKPFYL